MIYSSQFQLKLGKDMKFCFFKFVQILMNRGSLNQAPDSYVLGHFCTILYGTVLYCTHSTVDELLKIDHKNWTELNL